MLMQVGVDSCRAGTATGSKAVCCGVNAPYKVSPGKPYAPPEVNSYTLFNIIVGCGSVAAFKCFHVSDGRCTVWTGTGGSPKPRSPGVSVRGVAMK